MTDPIVDDSNPLISYLPAALWTTGGVAAELNGTTHNTSAAGATATFSFAGTSVSVYGTIDIMGDPNNPYNPVTTYSIDGSTAATYTGQRNSFAVQYRVPFFQSSILGPEQHTLVINNTVTKGRLILDYLQYTPLTTTVSATATSPTSSLGSSVSPSTTGSGTSTTTQAQSGVRFSSASVSAGAIVGAAIGGVAVLLLILFLLWWLRRMSSELKRSKEQMESMRSNVTPASVHPINVHDHVTPFTQTTSSLAPEHASLVHNVYGERSALPPRGYTVRGGTSNAKDHLRDAPAGHAAPFAADNFRHPENLHGEVLPSQARPGPYFNPYFSDQSSGSQRSDNARSASLDQHTYTRDPPPSYQILSRS